MWTPIEITRENQPKDSTGKNLAEFALHTALIPEPGDKDLLGRYCAICVLILVKALGKRIVIRPVKNHGALLCENCEG